MNNGTFCADDHRRSVRASQRNTSPFACQRFPCGGKNTPLQRKTPQGAAHSALRQKIAGGNQSTLVSGDVIEIAFAFLSARAPPNSPLR
jgi:hypothetical protein